MTQKFLAIFIATFLLTINVFAQNQVDTVKISKESKEVNKVQSKLVDDKATLAKMYQDKTKLVAESDKKHAEAMVAADKNAQIAKSMVNDADNKSKAKKATKSAKEAEATAKLAREASVRVENSSKEIKKLEKSIKKNEAKLKKLEEKASQKSS